MNPALSLRLRRALGNAAPGGSLVETSAWQVERDALVDLFEGVETPELTAQDTRRVIELLSESMPAEHSRMSASEWDGDVTDLVSQVLSASG